MLLTLLTTIAALTAPPIIPGLHTDGLPPTTRGHILINELGCTNCHTSTANPLNLTAKTAPRLSAVGQRVRADYLRRFIATPHATKPGTTMPDVFANVEARDAHADAITHYLLSLSADQFEPQAPDAIAARAGHELFQTVGCLACHSPVLSTIVGSIPLGPLDRKYSVQSLATFLTDPLVVRPSGRMPKLNLSPTEAYQLANYLLNGTRVPGPLVSTLYLGTMASDLDDLVGNVAATGIVDGFNLQPFAKHKHNFAVRFAGFIRVYHSGPHKFTLTSNDHATLWINSKLIVTTKANTQQAATQLKAGLHDIVLLYLHQRGTPQLTVHLNDAPIPSNILQSQTKPTAPYQPLKLDPEKIATGRELFTRFRCNNCHQFTDTPSVPARALAALDATKACPHFDLTGSQRADIRAVLSSQPFNPTPEQQIRAHASALNCIACHQRGDLGGIVSARNEYFLSTDPNLGEPGRRPPPLTGIGAKIQPDWLANTLALGQALRPYMKTRMPGFGEENTKALAGLLSATDKVEAVEFEPLPKERKAAQAVKNVGQQLVGNKAMNCIACHTFRGQGTSSMAAIDIVETTGKRLNKDWFYHYMLKPIQFRSDTIMPEYFTNGVSVFKDIEGGDPKKQLNAMWHYLASGRNVRQPSGMTRPSMEVVVGNEAVILRRQVHGTGRRAVSVGYPDKVNLVFDADTLAVTEVWRGRFVDASGIWLGQGSGGARPMERDRMQLGKGPPFAVLKTPDTPWPTNAKEAGHQFLGYDLDEHRRPTFRYRFNDIVVVDKPLDMITNDIAFLRRTLTFTSTREHSIYLRLATHRDIKVAHNAPLQLGPNHVLNWTGPTGDPLARLAAPEPPPKPDAPPPPRKTEALLPVTLGEGTTTVTIDYMWRADR